MPRKIALTEVVPPALDRLVSERKSSPSWPSSTIPASAPPYIAFRRIVLPVSVEPSTSTPSVALLAMVLPSAVTVPPIVLLTELPSMPASISTPVPLPRASVPVTSVPMESSCTRSPESSSSRAMPAASLAEMILRAPAAVPPIVTPVACSSSMPSVPLPRAIVPDSSVPMKSPTIEVPGPPTAAIVMPASRLAEITSPSPCAVPPIVTPEAPYTATPSPWLARASVPVWSVPISSPSTTTEAAPSSMSTPSPLLPEMTSRASAVEPPIVMPVPPAITTPLSPLRTAEVPRTSVPMKSPATRTVVESRIETP